jgi:hypothetical protein
LSYIPDKKFVVGLLYHRWEQKKKKRDSETYPGEQKKPLAYSPEAKVWLEKIFFQPFSQPWSGWLFKKTVSY